LPSATFRAAWLLIQVVETLTPDILPAVVVRLTVIESVIGFVPVLVLAWAKAANGRTETLARSQLSGCFTSRSSRPKNLR
jgi:hypothetical protein